MGRCTKSTWQQKLAPSMHAATDAAVCIEEWVTVTLQRSTPDLLPTACAAYPAAYRLFSHDDSFVAPRQEPCILTKVWLALLKFYFPYPTQGRVTQTTTHRSSKRPGAHSPPHLYMVPHFRQGRMEQQLCGVQLHRLTTTNRQGSKELFFPSGH